MGVGIDQQLERDLGLGFQRVYTPSSPSFQYGAGFLVRDYCGVQHEVPFVPVRWIHGWMPKALQTDHRIFTSAENELPRRIFVARHDETEFLESEGFRSVFAVGLPFAYVPEVTVTRRKNALLVMPVHSMTYTKHEWKFDEYVSEIDSIRSQFSEVVVCIHPSCLINGYWGRQFSSHGYRLISGADATDTNALIRMKTMLESFEYVTSNGFGSHLAYAVAAGCKTSLYGTFAEVQAKDCVDDPFYQKNPGLLESVLAATSSEAVRSQYPELFCDPALGFMDRDWGRHQIGADCRPSPARMAELMGWTKARYVALGIRNLVRRTFGVVDR